MAEEKSTKSAEGKETIPDQLKKVFQAGTEVRKGTKDLAGKAKLFVLWTVGVLILIWMTSIAIPYVQEKPMSATGDTLNRGSTTQLLPRQPQQMAEATWKGSAGETLPVGVWSETFSINVGCKTDYDAGVGTDFKVRYRFYSPEWKELERGTWPAANEVQFMLLKPRKAVPIKVTCQ